MGKSAPRSGRCSAICKARIAPKKHLIYCRILNVNIFSLRRLLPGRLQPPPPPPLHGPHRRKPPSRVPETKARTRRPGRWLQPAAPASSHCNTGIAAVIPNRHHRPFHSLLTLRTTSLPAAAAETFVAAASAAGGTGAAGAGNRRRRAALRRREWHHRRRSPLLL